MNWLGSQPTYGHSRSRDGLDIYINQSNSGHDFQSNNRPVVKDIHFVDQQSNT
jgi:hypothetical protein